jgi:RNA polymerase sigma-70 factor (ECF subfamily)
MQKLHFYESEPGTGNLTLYDLHAPTLYRFIYRQIGQTEDAEDILLEVFLAACKQNDLADLARQQQLAWLQSVARRKVIDRYRHRARITLLPLEQAVELLDSELTPEEHSLRREMYEQLYAAVARLPESQRQIVRLRYGEGLRFAEIAAMLNKSEGTVRKMLVRILRQLRSFYAISKEGL